MPTTPLNSHEKVEQVSDTLNLSSSKLISGESCYNAYDGTAIYYRYWLTTPLENIKQAGQQHTQQRQHDPHQLFPRIVQTPVCHQSLVTP